MATKIGRIEKSKIDGYNKKIKVLERKIEVSKQVLDEKTDKTLKKKALFDKKQIEKQEISLLGNESVLREKAKAKIDKFDHKQYWQRREAANEYMTMLFANQKGENSEEKKEQLAKEYYDKIEKFDLEREKVVNSIQSSNKGKVVAPKVSTDEGEKTLSAIRERSIKELEELESGLKENSQKKLEKVTKVANEKIEEINKKLAPYANKTSRELPDDVILSMKGLCKYFGGLKAVDELTFDVKKGEIFGLIGPNGAGKTTVFNCITQFYKPTKGEVLYRAPKGNIMELNEEKVHDVIHYGIVRTFQNIEIVWELSILENLLVAAHSLYQTGFFTHALHLPTLAREEKYMRKKALDILKFLNLEQYANYYPFGLPYGILKKVELARTLMSNPKLIILDEPAAGLNDKETEDLAKVIRKIRDEYGATIFLVEHDMGLVMSICDRICAISFGRMLALGTSKEIQANTKVQEAYLGSSDEE